MDSIRIKRWERDLSERVSSEIGNNDKEKIIWLIEHLGEYIQRWVGFSNMKEIGVLGTLNTDAFCIILGASEVVKKQAENQENEWFPKKEWEDFENALDYIQEYPSVNNLSIVTESFSRLRDSIP